MRPTEAQLAHQEESIEAFGLAFEKWHHREAVKAASAAPPINQGASRPCEKWSEAATAAIARATSLGWQPKPVAWLFDPNELYDPLVAKGKVGQVRVWYRPIGLAAAITRFIFLTEGDEDHNPVQVAMAAERQSRDDEVGRDFPHHFFDPGIGCPGDVPGMLPYEE
jgi:hypothetical protein